MHTTSQRPRVSDLPYVLLYPLLGFGPTVTVLVAARWLSPNVAAADLWWMVLLAVTLAWSPLPWTVPAWLLSSGRDATLVELRHPNPFHLNHVRRALRLIPAMLSRTNPVCGPFLVSVAGFAAGVAVTLATFS